MQSRANYINRDAQAEALQRAFFAASMRKRPKDRSKIYKKITVNSNIFSMPEDCVFGQLSALSVFGVTRNNLVKSSGMNTDSNADGVVDNFDSGNSISATFTLNDSSQKISINSASVNSSSASISQGNYSNTVKIPCTSGEIVSARVECKFTKTAGSPFTRLLLSFRDSGGAVIASYPVDVTSSTSGYTELKVENKAAPSNTAYILINFSLQTSGTASTTPETADVWFRNAMLEKAASVGNYISTGTKSTLSGRVKSIGKNLINRNRCTLSKAMNNTSPFAITDSTTTDLSDYIPVFPSTGYVKSGIAFAGIVYFDANKNPISGGSSTTTFTTPSNAMYIRLNIDKAATVPQLEKGSTATSYEPNTETVSYTPTGEYRSLPNGVFDENYVLDGIKKQNVGVAILNGTENWEYGTTSTNTYRFSISNWASANNCLGYTNNSIIGYSGDGNYPYMPDTVTDVRGVFVSTSLVLRVEKTKVDAMVGADVTAKFKAYLAANPITQFYQLASPVVTYYDPFAFSTGSLDVGPGYTMFFEPACFGVKKPVFGSGKMIVTTSDKPIKEIKKVIRFDVGDNGQIQFTDVTASASITDSGTSITITGADYTKSYFYDSDYIDGISAGLTADIEYPIGEDQTGYVVTHSYGAAAAAWTLSGDEAKATLLICTNAGGAANIIGPNTPGKPYIVRNTSGQAITIKTSSGTGVTVATGKTAMVINAGTDYVRITADN